MNEGMVKMLFTYHVEIDLQVILIRSLNSRLRNLYKESKEVEVELVWSIDSAPDDTREWHVADMKRVRHREPTIDRTILSRDLIDNTTQESSESVMNTPATLGPRTTAEVVIERSPRKRIPMDVEGNIINRKLIHRRDEINDRVFPLDEAMILMLIEPNEIRSFDETRLAFDRMMPVPDWQIEGLCVRRRGI